MRPYSYQAVCTRRRSPRLKQPVPERHNLRIQWALGIGDIHGQTIWHQPKAAMSRPAATSSLSSRPGRIYIYACSYHRPDDNGELQRQRLDNT